MRPWSRGHYAAISRDVGAVAEHVWRRVPSSAVVAEWFAALPAYLEPTARVKKMQLGRQPAWWWRPAGAGV
eukprot:6639988-Pyramimonas_sp.AAC.1